LFPAVILIHSLTGKEKMERRFFHLHKYNASVLCCFHINVFIFTETKARKTMETLVAKVLHRYDDLIQTYGGEYG
jgi:hypothetical protein